MGTVNTLLDLALFLLLHDRLGIVSANVVSTSVAMAFSFVANGRYTFATERLTARHAALFLATTGATMWVVQPSVITGLLRAADAVGTHAGTLVVLAAKLLAIGVSVTLNFLAYRFVVFRPASVRSEPQPLP